MKTKTMLLFKLQGIKDETTRKLIIKNWLEYHLESGETLDTRRSVEICNDGFCSPKKETCVSCKVFLEYPWCIPV